MAKERDSRDSKDRWRPDADYVSSLYRLRLSEGDEAKLRAESDDARRQTELRRKVDIPEQYKAIATEIRTPFTRDTWLRVTAALTQHPPVVHVTPTTDDQVGRAASSVAERWTDAVVARLAENLGEDVVHEAVKALVRDTESIIKVVHKPDAWARFPRRNSAESSDEYDGRVDAFKKFSDLPFAWRVVDRLCCLPGEGEFGLMDMIEYGEYPQAFLGHSYGMVDDGDKLHNPEYLLAGRPKPEGELITSLGHSIKMEYWDSEWWHVVIDGEDAPGFPKPNPYGQLPYFRARIADPVLLALRWLVPGLDALLTMKMNWAYLGAYPNPTLEPVETSQQLDLPLGDDGQPPEFVWKPGKMLTTPPGYRFSFLSPPPVGQDLNQMVAVLRDLIDIAGIPSVFRGVGGADQAGYAINQLIAAANLTYKILSLTAQRQLSQAISFIWRIVRYRIRQPVYVLAGEAGKGERAWLGLAPSGSSSRNVASVDRLARLEYTFRPVLPTDEQARAMIAMQLVNAPVPLSSPRHALEKYLQEEDPDAILDEAWVHRQLEAPPLVERITQEAMRLAGLGPEAAPNPAAALVGPNGLPLLPATPPGQAGAGMPAVPGLTTPIVPATPAGPAAVLPGQGGRPAGTFPGQPGGVPGR